MVKIKITREKILYWLLFAFLVYVAYELIRKVLGYSLGFEELMIALLVANIGHSFYLKDSVNKIDKKLSGHIGWHKGKNEK